MDKEPLVSIIMAVKDTAPYLHDCIDSIINQTYLNWELIAVNDHSTDETPNILADYAKQDARVRVFDSGDKTIRQSRMYVPYQPGKGLTAILTGTLETNGGNTVGGNTISRIGLFDDENDKDPVEHRLT